MGVLKNIGYVVIAIIGLCAVGTIIALLGLLGAVLGAIVLGTAIVYVVSIGIMASFAQATRRRDK